MSFQVLIHTDQAYPVISLRDAVTGTSADIYTVGGLLNAFTIRCNDRDINVIDGFSSIDDAIENITKSFKSTKLSPFVCRMQDGSYGFMDKVYRVNRHYLGKEAIHGLIYDSLYEITDQFSGTTAAGVTLKHRYTASDKGYPFAYNITLNWKLEKNNCLSVTTTLLNQHTHAIPVADGWHPYFTTGSNVDECRLQFSSTQQLAFDERLIPTGNYLPDERFMAAMPLKDLSLDNCFLLNQGGATYCKLEDDLVSITITPDKSYPYLQVYTPGHRKSIAIENLSAAPDAFNNGIGLLLLQPGEEKSFTTSYSVSCLV